MGAETGRAGGLSDVALLKPLPAEILAGNDGSVERHDCFATTAILV